MHALLKVGETEILSFLNPDSVIGALIYLVLVVTVASILSRVQRRVLHAAMTRKGHLIDLTTISFLQQFGSALIWVIMLTLYAHLIPALRSMGTALLAGASIASVVIGLAAQSTLGNLVAGISMTIYRPFQLGDTLQVATPTGTEIGIVEMISLGYTTLRTVDGRFVVLPNSLAASQVTINLNRTLAPSPTSIAIHVGREADLDAVRQLAVDVATEAAGEKSVTGCFLTKIEATNAIFELRFAAADVAHRDALRAQILAELAQRFVEVGVDSKGDDRPSFS